MVIASRWVDRAVRSRRRGVANTTRTVDKGILSGAFGKDEFEISFILEAALIADVANWLQSAGEEISLQSQGDYKGQNIVRYKPRINTGPTGVANGTYLISIDREARRLAVHHQSCCSLAAILRGQIDHQRLLTVNLSKNWSSNQ
jgi:hypothetical protein